MKRSKSTTSAADGGYTEDETRYVERRLRDMSDELEYFKEVLDFRTCVATIFIVILYFL